MFHTKLFQSLLVMKNGTFGIRTIFYTFKLNNCGLVLELVLFKKAQSDLSIQVVITSVNLSFPVHVSLHTKANV